MALDLVVVVIASVVADTETRVCIQSLFPGSFFSFFKGDSSDYLFRVFLVIDNNGNLISTWRPEGEVNTLAIFFQSCAEWPIVTVGLILEAPA